MNAVDDCLGDKLYDALKRCMPKNRKQLDLRPHRYMHGWKWDYLKNMLVQWDNGGTDRYDLPGLWWVCFSVAFAPLLSGILNLLLVTRTDINI